jgi:hypothetical protein
MAATKAKTHEIAQADLLHGLGACLSAASSGAGPIDGVRLPRGMVWPALDLPEMADHGPLMFNGKTSDNQDIFVGGGAGLFHPPVSGVYKFRLTGPLASMFSIGRLHLHSSSSEDSYTGTVQLNSTVAYPSLFVGAANAAGQQVKVSVDYAAHGAVHSRGGDTGSLDSVPSMWFTSPQLHSDRRLSGKAQNGASFADSVGLTVRGHEAVCRATTPTGCDFVID